VTQHESGQPGEAFAAFVRRYRPALMAAAVLAQEQSVAIWVARGPYGTLQQVWPAFRGRK